MADSTNTSEKKRILTGIRPTGVPEHAELTTWLAWFLPVGMLERNPTLKAEVEAIENPEDATTKGKSVPAAFYIYPVMQAANILLPHAHLVPVGKDQLPHIELTRRTRS